MKTRLLPALALALFASVASHAAAPANTPAGSTGVCKDGTYQDGAEKNGACRGHQGVKDWWGPAQADAKADAKPVATAQTKAATAPPAPAAAATTVGKPAATTTTAATPAPATPVVGTPAKADAKPAAPGGGAGMVWVNESSKVYHCQGDKWYGKTKEGEYLKEADAKAKGAKAAGGKACAA